MLIDSVSPLKYHKRYPINEISLLKLKVEMRNTINDEQGLKRVLNQVQLKAYNQAERQYEHQDITHSNQDNFERKNRLLDQRMAILQKTTVQMQKRFFTVFNIIAILSISGLQLGFGICQITSIYNQGALMKSYGIQLPIGAGIGLLVGAMPIGAVFGKLFGKCIFAKLNHKISHHINNLLCMVSSFALMQITVPATIFIGRLLYGWCIGYYCFWSPRYIQDVVPVNLRRFSQSVYSIWIVGAMMIGYFFGLVFYLENVGSYFRIIFCFPGIMALTQLVLMIIFVPNNPAQLFEKQEYDQGRKVIQIIYKEDFVNIMVDRYKLQAQVKALKKLSIQSNKYPQYRVGTFRAKFMGIFLNIFRQFVGTTTVIIYSGLIIGQTNNSLGSYTNFILSVIAFAGTVISHLFIAERVSRRFLMLLASVSFTVCNFLIMAGMITQTTALSFTFMVIFVIIFGLTYAVISSIYPSQILRYERPSYTTLTAWPAMVFACLIPPIISDQLPTHTPWPIFLFYGIFALLSTFYIWFFAVESKGRQYVDIIRQF